jgi:hypothetical protein
MGSEARALRRATLLFFTAAAAIYALGAAIVRALPGLERPGPVAAAVGFDLTVTVTALAWLLPVRCGRWPAITLVPLLLVSVVAAHWILPPEAGGPLAALRLLAAGAELTLLGWLGWRILHLARRAPPAGPSLDLLARARRTARELVGSNRAAEIVGFELAVLGYALGPRRAPHAPAGSVAFSVTRRSAYGAVVGALALAISAETIPLHPLLARWSSVAAWIATALGPYTLLYLVADWRAAHARPILLDLDSLLVRTGIRWTVEVPRCAIAEVVLRPPRDGPRALLLAPLGSPNLWLRLAEPAEAHGVYGVRRRASLLALAVDEPDRPAAALASRRGASRPARDAPRAPFSRPPAPGSRAARRRSSGRRR